MKPRPGRLARAAVAALSLAGLSAPSAAAPHLERRVLLMGTRATLAVRSPARARGLAQLERMLRELERAEAELSTWREDSLLSRLNAQPVGEPRSAADPLCDLLEELQGWREETGGAFDPGVGRLLEAWGVRSGGRRPSPGELAAALRDSGLRHLTVGRAPCRVGRGRDVALDAGAFGKGEAIDRLYAAEPAPAADPWLVDLGGQVAAGASRGEPWPVALAHPSFRDRAALQLRLDEGSLASSGGSERDLAADGARIGHVVDPRDGRTVARDLSVAVWHERGLVADVLSTALYVMGVEDGLAWAETRGIAACFLLPRGPGVELRATDAFRRRFALALTSSP